ncbi:hypothetical protein CKAN_01858300 [Cinnamomum micranthum f. kanehirae]|uniref:Uncharacterized protein n=1 Tax=Cinnamomum micranthum f. kanehirae TaxID=337451 RepID=A0A3S3QRW2_9MAGN|nr:hypothetical protein CKAN_01858300 [Cinnamomum micranthum f. kanehirae]
MMMMIGNIIVGASTSHNQASHGRRRRLKMLGLLGGRRRCTAPATTLYHKQGRLYWDGVYLRFAADPRIDNVTRDDERNRSGRCKVEDFEILDFMSFNTTLPSNELEPPAEGTGCVVTDEQNIAGTVVEG